MPDYTTLLHITDPHLLAQPEAYLHGWPVASAFKRVLDTALQHHPEISGLILGGDLVDDESIAGYQWLARQLQATGLPVLAVAGNHDQPRHMATYLQAATVHGSLYCNGWHLLGLCTHWPGHKGGQLGQQQLTRLADQLAQDHSPTLLCLHHPPIDVNSTWLDAIGLQDRQPLIELLQAYPQVKALLCGHAHQACQGQINNGTPVWITPATMRQFLPESTDFAEDHDRAPGYRLVRLGPNDHVETSLHRLYQPDSFIRP